MGLHLQIRQAVAALSADYGWEWDDETLADFCRQVAHYAADAELRSQAALQRLIRNLYADGPTVRIALDPAHPRCEQVWAELYGQITGWLHRHQYFPQDAASLDGFSPDLCAFEDLRRNLPSFNYRSRLTTFVNRITELAAHQWLRANAAFKRGGRGVASASVRRGERPPRAWNICYLSQAVHEDSPLCWDEILPSSAAEPAALVEGAELMQTVERSIMALEDDPQFPVIHRLWRALLFDQPNLSALARQWDVPAQTVFNARARLARRVAPVLERWHHE